MEILTAFVQLWLLCGCIGLIILFVASLIASKDTYPVGVTNPFEIFLLAIAIMIFPLFGPFTLAISIQKVREAINE